VSTHPNSALERYLAHLRTGRRLAANTLGAYARDGALLATLSAGREPSGITAQDIRRFIATLHGKGLSPRSLARVLSSWRGFFEWLMRRHEITANPCGGVRAPKAAKTLPATLSPDEAVRLVAIDDDSDMGMRDHAIFELAYSSGLRVSELAGLDVESLDASTGEVRVTGKGSKTRIVPVGEPALKALAAWGAIRARLARPGENALFVGRSGRRVTARELQRRIKRWAAAGGIDADVHPAHAAPLVRLARAAVLRRPARVQEMLGHASIASTQVYTHLDFQHLAKVYDAGPSAFASQER
jgi:integrase/recombinase XerC